MKLHDSAVVNAPTERVWPYLADPGLIPTWNPKLVSIDRSGGEPVRAGEEFSAQYEMSGRRTACHITVVESQPPVEVVYRHQIEGGQGKEIVVTESYRLDPDGYQTRVSQVIDMGPGAIPWWIKPLVWLLTRFGRSPDGTIMEKLAEVVEKDLSGR